MNTPPQCGVIKPPKTDIYSEAPHLRRRRHDAGLTLQDPAAAINTQPSRISALERGDQHNLDLATRYQHWLTHNAA